MNFTVPTREPKMPIPAPEPLPLSEMSLREQRDYWRWYARKHEDALNGLLDDLRDGVPVRAAIRRADARRQKTSPAARVGRMKGQP